MKITCDITHNESDSRLLEKFYQVIFWENDLKSLDIYTAFVFCNDSVSTLGALKIEFGCDNSTIRHENKTNLLEEEISAFKAVWNDGNNLEIIEESGAKYLKLNSSSNKISILKIATQLSNYYEISPPSSACYPGCVGFTKTSITLKKNNNTKDGDIKFEDTLEFILDFKNIKTKDNSIYFILPMGYAMDKESQAASIDTTEIKTPYQYMYYGNRETYLKEWLDKDISKRSYYRVIKDFKSTDDNNVKFEFKFALFNKINPVLTQVLYAFFISLFFSYGLDQTRLLAYKNIFPSFRYIPPDINFFSTYSLLFLTILFKVSMGNKKEWNWSCWIRKAAIMFSCLWFITIFWYGANEYYSHDSPSNFQFSHGATFLSEILNKAAFLFNSLSCIVTGLKHRHEIRFSIITPIKKLFTP